MLRWANICIEKLFDVTFEKSVVENIFVLQNHLLTFQRCCGGEISMPYGHGYFFSMKRWIARIALIIISNFSLEGNSTNNNSKIWCTYLAELFI